MTRRIMKNIEDTGNTYNSACNEPSMNENDQSIVIVNIY